MPRKSPLALPWCEFETLINLVYEQAKEPGNQHLYRFLIFAGVVAHYGFHTDEALSLRWKYFGFGLANGIGGHCEFTTDTGSFAINAHQDFMDIAHKAFSIAFPSHVKRFVHKNDPILQEYIVPSLRSDGTKPLTHKSLNQLLISVTEDLGYDSERISALVFRKTWARRQFELHGQNKKTLSAVKQALKCKSLDKTRAFIALPGENGVLPMLPSL